MLTIFFSKQHIIYHPDYAPNTLTFNRAAKLNVALGMISPDHFRELQITPAAKLIPDEYAPVETPEIPLTGGVEKSKKKKKQQQQQQLRQKETAPRPELTALPLLQGTTYLLKGKLISSNASKLATGSWRDPDKLANTAVDMYNEIIERNPKRPGKILNAEANHELAQFQAYNKRKRRIDQLSADSEGEDADGAVVKPAKFSDVSCITCGTGSATPGVFRNVIGTIIRLPFYDDIREPKNRGIKMPPRSILFDVGESTLQNLTRMFGAQIDDLLREIKLITISHMHADHFFGIITMLRARNSAVENSNIEKLKRGKSLTDESRNLFIIGPRRLISWLEEWEQIYPGLLSDVQFVDNSFFRSDDESSSSSNTGSSYATAYRQLRRDMNITQIVTCRAVHAQFAHSLSITFDNKYKLAYSGDTRPNAAFAAIGRDADLLIHEATMEDALLPGAIAKRHSTISEAIGVGYVMNARNILLTHFSQRYAVFPVFTAESASSRLSSISTLNEDSAGRFLLEQSTELDSMRASIWNARLKLGLAYDGMIMRVGEFNCQGGWVRPLSEIFSEMNAEIMKLQKEEKSIAMGRLM
ncbi:beta-lactamase-like protein [Kockiozyma suomiensis]|uniref:beta-lactamase-like protein n=1 Tax=Kockiozyma suomiensis TaxID=1337062 RepID=UPI0033431AF1